MDLTATTTIGLLALMVVAIVYDVIAALTKPEGDTISEVIKAAARNWLFLPVGWGALLGHFFSPLPALSWGLAAAVILGVVLVAFDVWRRVRGRERTWLHEHALVGGLGGVAFGATVWPLG